MKTFGMNRRYVVVLGLLAVAGVLALGGRLLTERTTVLGDTYYAPPAASTTPLTREQKEKCGYVQEVTQGPFYIKNAPALTDGNLNYGALPGTPIVIYGKVFEGLGTSTPLANTVLDIWQADAHGTYYPDAHGDAKDFPQDALKLRGTITTDEHGYYEFSTIFPGEYAERARHIHLKLRAPGKPEVTTQLILALKGDTLSFDDDTISRGLPYCAHLTPGASTPPPKANFDFHIK